MAATPSASRKRILTYITDDSNRKTTFKKRKKSLVKKARELSVLCGVTVCAVVCSPFREIETEVFPDEGGVREAYARFKGMTQVEQTRRKYSQETITEERYEKVKSKALKVSTGNQEKEMTEMMYQYLSGQLMSLPAMNLVHLNDLAVVTQRHLERITEKLAALGKEGDSVLMPPPPPRAPASMDMGGGMRNDEGNGMYVNTNNRPEGPAC
ncbi:PREDICTED: agamous-like MADS-box protein AGL80 [Ipomoea nil]|uniref:agamous-like MADS-box protein AGL80 n=1 Tax=Ipomoea nil TaxID=35883 RepID=UPI000901BCE4|nr:PREDICTED: agamous-like MADS-box protein AGL80 [Ipomoea nil]